MGKTKQYQECQNMYQHNIHDDGKPCQTTAEQHMTKNVYQLVCNGQEAGSFG